MNRFAIDPTSTTAQQHGVSLGPTATGLDVLLEAGVATTASLRAAGARRSWIEGSCRGRGPWRPLLPGVLLLADRPPTRFELLRAALLYAGASAMVTGLDAMIAAGVPTLEQHRHDRQREPSPVHVLLPASRRVRNVEFFLGERTTRMPCAVMAGGVAFAPAVRATTDAARRVQERRALVALLTPVVSSGACTTSALMTELEAGSGRGAAAPRAVLGELRHGMFAAAHHRARRVVAAAGLPQPRWGSPVHDEHGRRIGFVDAWWQRVGLAWDFGALDLLADGPRPRDRRSRDETLTARRALVLRTPVDQLRGNPCGLRRMVSAAYRKASQTPPPPLRGG